MQALDHGLEAHGELKIGKNGMALKLVKITLALHAYDYTFFTKFSRSMSNQDQHPSPCPLDK